MAASKSKLKAIQGETNFVHLLGSLARWRRKLATLLALTSEIRGNMDSVLTEELGVSFDENQVMGSSFVPLTRIQTTFENTSTISCLPKRFTANLAQSAS